MSDHPAFEASRRSVIRGGAIGAGALIGALGLGAGQAAAATPAVGPTVVGSAGLPVTDAAAVGPRSDRLFMKLDGIPGDSMYKGYEDWIELAAFSWGVQNTTAPNAGGGAGAGKAQPLEFSFSGPTSKASPLLFKSTASGQHIKSGQLVVTHDSRSGMTPFLKYELTDVLIDFYKNDMTSSSSPTDAASLNFTRVKMTYTPQDSKGAIGQPVTTEWDLRSNKVE